MCGLSGILLARPVDPPELRARLRAMIATLRHRGPDDEGVWSDADAGLAHARLAVIDRSSAGHQPIADEERRIWLVFNGEIYNFVALRAELEQKGHRFRSRTDSEVVVCGYKEWGDGVFARLRGMFAVAIWDCRRRRLVLARDRLGKKPLFYAETPAGLIFGSEIKAILAWPGVARSPNLPAIDQYLSLRYVPSPHTAFAGIHALRPAHVMTVELTGDGRRATATRRYWSLPDPRQAVRRRATRALCDELIARVEEAVRIRTSADVPLGVFLSGGIDSSAVVAMMARGGAGRIATFSVGFTDAAYDETAYARLVAARYGTDHHVLTVGPDAAGILPRLVWHYNQPFADPAAVPTFQLAQLARRHVTVALNGDGGDECFIGYDRYALVRRASLAGRVPHPIRCAFAAAVDCLPGRPRFVRRRSALARILRERAMASQACCERISCFTGDMKREGYGAALRECPAASPQDLLAPYFSQAPDPVSAANWADLHTYLPDNLMVKMDVATMAHGLENRSPLLDHELMEWAAGLSVSTRMAHGVTKHLFKKALEPYLPAAVVHRPKMGFGVPAGEWLRTGLKEMTGDLLLSASFAQRGLFDASYVRRLFDAQVRRVDAHDTRLWALLMLELWFQTWIDGRASRDPPAHAPVLSRSC